ncbi:hypothetical protein [Streptomyces sp. NPDC059783]|uniref:hypothetical protein n=1 Tax=Streptomyces sp. NPDC059783 TaxID=3346944 RepID=UPI0036616F4C
MARLQILELPEGTGDDRPPFVLVVDECEPQRHILGLDQPDPIDPFDRMAEKIGARAVLVFAETIEIPANEITLDSAAADHVVRLRVEPDLTGFTDKVVAEAVRARAAAGAVLR